MFNAELYAEVQDEIQKTQFLKVGRQYIVYAELKDLSEVVTSAETKSDAFEKMCFEVKILKDRKI